MSSVSKVALQISLFQENCWPFCIFCFGNKIDPKKNTMGGSFEVLPCEGEALGVQNKQVPRVGEQDEGET